jgi:hypothetical protein
MFFSLFLLLIILNDLDILPLPNEEEINEAVEILGGRLSDLERVIVMVKDGTPLQSIFSLSLCLS